MAVAIPNPPAVTLSGPDAANLELLIETLEENLADAQLAIDSNGWAPVGGDATPVLNRQQLRSVGRMATVMAVADPLIRRAVNLRVAYVWGQGVTIQAKTDTGGQDINAVIQAFLDDPSNQATFASQQAHEELERRLATQGQCFDALVTSPLTGRVQVRNVPDAEIDDVVSNPEDATEPWFYRRTFTAVVTEQGYAGVRTRRETRTVYYPALGYWPKYRPTTIDGRVVEWDKPVLHTTVNRPDGSPWGVGDLHAALPWARGYKDFLEDWARLVKALSRFAFRATASSKRGAANVRDRLSTQAVNPDGTVGATVVTGEGQSFEAIGKSGATIDSGSGRPLAAMVAAGTDLPVTMLLSDPGVTGARATAETLDRPMELIFGMRRELHTVRIRRILNHVIDQAVKAPQGPLRGTRTVDQVTGREVIDLAAGQDRGIEVTWPDLSTVDVKTQVDAIVAADGVGKLPPLLTVRLLLVALGVDNVDEVLQSVTDDDGEFIDPVDHAAARSAVAALNRGDQPEGV